MGRAKAWLPVDGRSMAATVVAAVREGLKALNPDPPLVVVAAAHQDLPPLENVLISHDQVQGEGPLRGMEAGFAALGDQADIAFVASCDTPLLRPAFVTRMVELLGEHQIAVPVVAGRHHPLAAVYTLDLLDQVRALLAAQRRRPYFLLEAARTREITPEELADVDPHMASLRNVNTPAEYQDLVDAGSTS
jgi:molybdopterin-guanine dinucleotide biosynthesis protein A